ncbi:Hypothetical predicted protein [Mytilus galloprovincialis]|uniref:Uncharacterized protein n=1 Tax=Mytilus galloprovincialis TaxID=29158 RepID=A0A8B6D3Y4_MYTGA|nr:Hypothetical predicted protein [Mytilus galloprovincialis]
MNWSTRLTLWMVAFCITMTHVNSYVQTSTYNFTGTLDKKVASAFLCQKGCRFAQRGIGGEEERYRELQERKREDPEFMV